MPELKDLGPLLARATAPYEDAQAGVLSRDRTYPPPTNVAGDRYIVAAPATGAWTGKENYIAEYTSQSTWSFITPLEGISAWVHDENAELFYRGSTLGWGPNSVDVSRGIITPRNRRMRARVTTFDGDRACDIAMLATPAVGGRISVEVNGLDIPEVGDGSKDEAACYFSRDGGYTCLPLDQVVAGDCCYWQGSIAGYELDGNDVISFVYEVA